MEKSADVLSNYETRTSIWIAFSAILICVAILAWHSVFNLPPMIEKQTIIIDSLRVQLDTLRVREEMRLIEDARRKKAWEEWNASFQRDEERKRKWDADNPKYKPGE